MIHGRRAISQQPRGTFAMHAMLNIAIRAARAAGDIMVRYVDRVDALAVDSKGENDFVTEVDRQAEQAIINTIRKAYPSHGILAEESGRTDGDEFVWIIDPLDGTTNFLHGFPQFAVSIAVRHKQRLEHGVVFDPLRQELFTTTRGAGAQLNERRIRVGKRAGLQGALIGTGFPFRSLAALDEYLGVLRVVIEKTAGIRRAGSAALDLAWVAAGRLDGFWEFKLNTWDLAAGALLIKEAGGIVSSPGGGAQSWLDSGNIVAGNPKVLKELLRLMQPHLSDELRD
jgi:myo-inositol-1(or 4)-monophosphatase